MPNTLLITGGVGFIGSNYVAHVLSHRPNVRVVCLDALTYAAHLASVESALADPRFVLERADIADKDAVYRIFERHRPHWVVNFAAESHVDRSIVHPDVFVRTNVVGTANLLDACLAYGVQRYHQVSTDEVYGDLPLDSGDRFVEGDPLRPSSPYSASKAAGDMLTLAYHRTYGLAATVSRAGNNYGRHQFPEKLIPLCILNALADKPIPVYGDGRNVRDWLWVEDHCRAIDLILQRGEAGEIYNVGGDAERDNLHVVSAVLRALGKPLSLVTHVSDRPGHDRRYALDSAKLHALGWQPTMPFEDGLIGTVNWYVHNEKWWKPLVAKMSD